MRKTLVALVALVAVAATGQADPLKLKLGAAADHGQVLFKLSSKVPLVAGITVDELVTVNAVVGMGMTAQEKAAAIRTAVAVSDSSGDWRAVGLEGATLLSFEHRVDGVWKAVDGIVSLVDTTGAGTALQAQAESVVFNLDIDPQAVAVGTDAAGAPSFITVAVTNTLTFTRAIQAGDTAEVLVNAFAAFLAGQGTEGVAFERVSPTSLTIRIGASLNPTLNWQITDAGLLNLATAGAVIGDGQDARITER